ncbi:MAG TPA: hypothetical protein VFZ42_01930 [Chitinophagaceae bacterium]
MKYLLVLAIIISLNSDALFAQSRKTIRVKAGDDIAQTYSKQGFYRLPNFSKATLHFKTGSKNDGILFNYSIISGNMQFIGPKGDTLEMGGTASIDSITFPGTVFYNNDGFQEVAARVGSFRLLKKVNIRMQSENIGAYGQPNPTSSIVNYTNYFSGTNVYNLTINQDIIIVETIIWSFMDAANATYKPSKATLLQSLPADKKAVAEAYLQKNKVNFDKEKDLLALMNELNK